MYSLVLLLKAAVVLAVVNFCVPGAEKSELTIYDVGTARDGLRYYTFFCVALLPIRLRGRWRFAMRPRKGNRVEFTANVSHPFLTCSHRALRDAAAVETIRQALFERTANV